MQYFFGGWFLLMGAMLVFLSKAISRYYELLGERYGSPVPPRWIMRTLFVCLGTVFAIIGALLLLGVIRPTRWPNTL